MQSTKYLWVLEPEASCEIGRGGFGFRVDRQQQEPKQHAVHVAWCSHFVDEVEHLGQIRRHVVGGEHGLGQLHVVEIFGAVLWREMDAETLEVISVGIEHGEQMIGMDVPEGFRFCEAAERASSHWAVLLGAVSTISDKNPLVGLAWRKLPLRSRTNVVVWFSIRIVGRSWRQARSSPTTAIGISSLVPSDHVQEGTKSESFVERQLGDMGTGLIYPSIWRSRDSPVPCLASWRSKTPVSPELSTVQDGRGRRGIVSSKIASFLANRPPSELSRNSETRGGYVYKTVPTVPTVPRRHSSAGIMGFTDLFCWDGFSNRRQKPSQLPSHK